MTAGPAGSSLTDHLLDTLVAALADDPQRAVLATDFDGVLAPIVDHPEHARPHPDALLALARLGRNIGQLVVITGRPARTAVQLGGLDIEPGLRRLVVLGQYGVERWDGATDTYAIPPVPEALGEVRRAVPHLLAEHGWPDARIEDKGRALAIHTRTLSAPDRALAELTEPVRRLAEEHGLHLEPGRRVLEVRQPGMDKGVALRSIVAEVGARTVIYAGDDLGDVPAFETVRDLAAEGLTTCAVWSASAERESLPHLTDVAVDGPAGVAAWLTVVADRVERRLSGHG